MRKEYKLYTSSKGLEDNLNPKEKVILDNYLKFCGITAGKRKLEVYKRYMLQFRDILEKPLSKVTRDDAVEMWSLIHQSAYEPNSKVMIKRTIKRFLKWYYKDLSMIEGLKNQSPVINEKKINQNTLITPEEIERLLRVAESLRDKAMLILLYETASRPQEIKDLKWKDINLEKKEVSLFSTKKKSSRTIPINNSVVHLERYKQEYPFENVSQQDYVFPSSTLRMRGNLEPSITPQRDKPLSVEYLGKLLKRLGVKAGITKELYPYILRHSRLTELYKKGVQGISHNMFSGHKIGSKSQGVYVHLNSDDMKSEILEKVYNVREISPEKKHQLELEIEKLKKDRAEDMKLIKEIKEMHDKSLARFQQSLEEAKKLSILPSSPRPL